MALSVWLTTIRLATTTNLTLAAACVYLLLSGAFTASFFMPRTIRFSFAGQNCVVSPTLLPNLIVKDRGHTFVASPVGSVTIAGYPIYSHRTCVSAAKAPQNTVVDHISFSPLGIPGLKKVITVTSGTLPSVDYPAVLGQPIAPDLPLILPMNEKDVLFDYQLSVDDQKIGCTKTDQALICDINKLGLAQSASYQLTLRRLFNGQPQGVVFGQTVATVGAVTITSSSISAGQTVFDTPSELSLGLNKPAKMVGNVQLNLISDAERQIIPTTSSLNGQTITVRFGQSLPRSSSFELTIDKVVAADGGHLPAPFVLPFTTSGGPKIKSVNIGSYKVATTANVVLTFDSALASGQNLSSFIKLEIGGNLVAASLSQNGASVTINPTDSLPKCTSFTVKVINGLQNEFGISGGSAWQLSSRTICQSIFSIGTSVQGRAITGYRFGSGGSYVVYVGGTHGNEQSSVRTLTSWIDYLERNYDQIPANRTIVVIPNLNPDGYAKNQRTNAHDVDLNRNFPTYDWKQGVTMPGGSYNSNGGGSEPLSEPESKALANYVLGINPRLVLTYHAAAGVVIPNDSGDSVALAQIYDQKSNLGFESNDQTGTIFNYDTTGAFEDWLHDKHNLPALLIELWTMGSNEFTKNQNAMWHMVGL